jgi:predicted ATPase
MRHLPSGTVTFLFTDVEGSTKLLHELGAEAYAEALAEHRRLIREACAAEGGVEVDTQGDAFFFAFPTAPGALAAAEAMTESLSAGQIQVRIGLHTGRPMLTDEGYIGDDVHFGARIASTGHGGQVVLSKATRDLAEVELTDLGEHRLKDIPEAVPIFQLGNGAFPPLKTISNTNLPRPASSFVGRDDELLEVLSRFEEGARLVTLTGPGGTGKTRLAMEAAATLVSEYKAGVFWVGLATLRDPALVTETIAQTLGARDGLAEHIGERELLLLLDNLEQVIDCAPLLSELLSTCANLTLLCTSRERLRIRGEVTYAVPPLAQADAVSLFCERSQLDADAAIGELCRRLDDMPLAVELAAARTSAMTPAQILDRLSQRLDLLKGGRDADPRQQTLRATIEWSYDLLFDEEQTLFYRLSVFSGGCTLEAAEEVCDADLDTLQSLVDKSLLRFTDGRYWMLETIREYAARQLAESSEATDVQHKHADWFLSMAEELEPPQLGGVSEDSLAQLTAETANLRAAIDFFTGCPDPTGELRLVGSLFRFWHTGGFLAEGLAVSERALQRARDDSPSRIKVLYSAAVCAAYLGDFPALARFEDERLRIARILGDDVSAAVALNDLGIAAEKSGDLERARSFFAESVTLAESIGDDLVFVAAKGNLARSERTFGNAAASREALEAQLPAVGRLGDEWVTAYVTTNLGHALFELGEEADAVERYRETLALSVCPPDLVAECLDGLAAIALHDGDPTRAATLAAAAGTIRTERGLEAGDLSAHIERAESEGRAALGDDAWDAAYAEGARMTLEEAVAYALEDQDA